MKQRRTRQLEAIHDELCAARDHPTAAELHRRVRRALPQVSLGTVYRNLEKLIAAGRAISVEIGGPATRYDGMVTPHDHFVCEECGEISDLSDALAPAVDTRSLGRQGFAVRAHRLSVFGVCLGCRPSARRTR